MEARQTLYRRFVPDAGLRDYVEYFWIIKSPGSPQAMRQILIPNGRPMLVLSLASPGIRIDPLTGTRTLNKNTLFGISSQPYILEQQDASHFIGAQLQPYGLAAFLPHERLVNQFMPVENWLGDETQALVRSLSGDDWEVTVHTMEQFLASKVRPLKAALRQRLQAVVTAVEEAKGLLSVEDLAAKLHLSPSALYRLFRRYTGVSPKQFIDITRYYYFVGELLGDMNTNSTALLAALQGYYDQSHAAKDFKKFTGISPNEFKHIYNGIARLMHS